MKYELVYVGYFGLAAIYFLLYGLVDYEVFINGVTPAILMSSLIILPVCLFFNECNCTI